MYTCTPRARALINKHTEQFNVLRAFAGVSVRARTAVIRTRICGSHDIIANLRIYRIATPGKVYAHAHAVYVHVYNDE